MTPIIESTREPYNTHTIWLDPRDSTIKIFGPNGWQAISGVQSEGVEELRKAIKDIDSSLNDNKSESIDTFGEVKEFLDGFSDKDNLKEYINQEIDIDTIPEDELNNILT